MTGAAPASPAPYRRIFEADDFGAELTPELLEQEERIRKEIEEK